MIRTLSGVRNISFSEIPYGTKSAFKNACLFNHENAIVRDVKILQRYPSISYQNSRFVNCCDFLTSDFFYFERKVICPFLEFFVVNRKSLNSSIQSS